MKKGISPPGRSRAGFSLVELLVATAIMLIFGLMAVTTLRYGSRLWRLGNRRSSVYSQAAAVFNQFENDFAAAKSQFWGKDADAFDVRVRFWVDGDALNRPRLRMVRGIPEDAVNPRIRQAGDGADNDSDGRIDEEVYNLKDDDGDGLIDEDLTALEGMCEVAYLMGLDDDPTGDGWTDHTTLYRAVLAPIGRGDSLFWNANIDGATEIYNPSTGGGAAMPLAENVLYFGLRMWTQYTTTWDPAAPFRRWTVSYRPEQCGPTFTWDSDRLGPGAGLWTPPFLMDWGQPGFPDSDDDLDGTSNSQDADYVRDNVFPRAVMVILVLDPPAELADLTPPRLASDISAADTSIAITGDLPAYNAAWPYLRIGNEWIEFSSFRPAPGGGTFTVAPSGRGVRGTAAAAHARGDIVRLGTTFSRVFNFAAARDYWGQ